MQTNELCSIHDMLKTTVNRCGTRDAYKWFSEPGRLESVSWNQFYDQVKSVSKSLIRLGVEKGDKVNILSYSSYRWVLTDLGISCAGACTVGIYHSNLAQDCQYIIDHSDAVVIFAQDETQLEKLMAIREDIPDVRKVVMFSPWTGDDDWVMSFEDFLDLGADVSDPSFEERAEETTPLDPAAIVYTSGTTGVPKGVMLSHNNLVSNFTEHAKLHDLGIEHRALSFLPLCHVYERSVNYHFQYRGMGVYYVGNLSQIVSSIKEVKPHMFNSVPRLLEKVYDGFVAKGKELTGIKRKLYFWALNLTRHFEYNKKFGPLMRLKISIADKLIYSKWREALGGNITYIVSGGAALQPRIARVFGMAKLTTLEGYGLTETSPVIAVNNPTTMEMMVGTVGPILEGYDVKFAPDGEILCKGPGIMMGYYKAPELTEEVIDKNGWFHTGDIGVLVDDKYLKITDRKKEIFKLSGGKYIAPQMIENKLKTSELIEQVMVVGANEKFASAIISPCFPILHDWAGDHKLHYENNEDLIQLPEVINKLQKEVAKINKTLGSHEQISRIRLVHEEWTPTSGELSPTLKLRRNAVAVKYQHLIDDIYAVGAKK